MLQQLLQQANFLALTLANPVSMAAEQAVIAGHTRVELWDSGVLVFTPLHTEATRDIVLSSGIHGNETAPIELCNQLIQAIVSQNLLLQQRVMFIFGNPPTINNHTRFVSENLNRLFNGEHANPHVASNGERLRAARLEAYVERFFMAADRQRLHYDLHTAIRASRHERFAVCPYRPDKPHLKQQLAFLNAAGVEAFLMHHEPTTTFSYASSTKYQAEAFTVELGKVMPFGQNDLTKLAAMRQMLVVLLSEREFPRVTYQPDKLVLYRVCRSLNKHYADFAFNFSNELPNFTQFAKGELLAQEQGIAITAAQDGEAIVFPNAQIPVGQRAALCVVADPAIPLA
ncbi:succinylglutamate desuccinylase [Shewanella dokdonensis]|uniref:Succinylglutamate desuccinylase n=1 Tax=Shewanella dokdonensis TaxID=712036 RepID=A0ABX8DE96_9GAMM|nr:succinylglutamate desuccinylase [Shewanella dokdonensis]MCL1073041.1 succinylglutamate desuccinylase [Shewanella dokdonensis]QVK23057.1 succinylglutamate desuccinylase [Shewanella dokdonensis]